MRRRAIKKRDLLHKFQRRRLQNFLKEDEVVGCTRAQPIVPPPPPLPSREDPQHSKRSQIPKDRAFYKRNGFIWSDLGLTPKARLALVVPPIAVKREREFIEQLLRKVEAEDVLTRLRAKEQHERVAAQRERLRTKVRRLVYLQSSMPVCCKVMSGHMFLLRATNEPGASRVLPSTLVRTCDFFYRGRLYWMLQEKTLTKTRRLQCCVLNLDTSFTTLLGHAGSSQQGTPCAQYCGAIWNATHGRKFDGEDRQTKRGD